MHALSQSNFQYLLLSMEKISWVVVTFLYHQTVSGLHLDFGCPPPLRLDSALNCFYKWGVFERGLGGIMKFSPLSV